MTKNEGDQRYLYVLDSSVLIHDPECIYQFEEHKVAIPSEVLNELDKIKSEASLRGKLARQAQRNISRALGNNPNRNRLPTGGEILLILPPYKIIKNGTKKVSEVLGKIDTSDNKIICTADWAKSTLASEKCQRLTLVTKDIGMALKARACDLNVEDYRFDKVPIDPEIEFQPVLTTITQEQSDLFLSQGFLELDPQETQSLEINQYGLFNCEKKIPYRYVGGGRFIELKGQKGITINRGAHIKARNLEQLFLLDALLDPNIDLVTAKGMAGTGKTILTMAAGLHLIETNRYTGMCISKPIESVGKENGFLPGPQPLKAKILTPTGWTTMGGIKVGDKIIAWDGTHSTVLKLFPQGKNEVYKIKTKEGKSTQACESHPWLTQTYEEFNLKMAGIIKSTKEIANNLLDSNRNPNAILPKSKLIDFDKQPIKLPAYSLGALLGNGCLDKNSISIISKDIEIINRIKKELAPLSYKLIEGGHNHYISKVSSNKDKLKAVNGITSIKRIVSHMGLINKKASKRFIPNQYKYNSIDIRHALIQGLMDTHGQIKKNGECNFVTISPQLASDFLEIVYSLGGKGKLKKQLDFTKGRGFGGKKKIGKHKYIKVRFYLPTLNPCYLPRKAQRFKAQDSKWEQHDYIKSIKPTRKKMTQCILIDHPDHLYITDDYIVTHNTIEDKMRPWLQPYADAINFLHRNNPPLNKKQSQRKSKQQESPHLSPYDRLTQEGLLEITAIEYIRGRSIPHKLFVLDEVQNVPQGIIKTIASRMAEGSKLVCLGDIEQIDNPYLDRYSNGLSHLQANMKNLRNAVHIQLWKGERSLLAEQAAKLL